MVSKLDHQMLRAIDGVHKSRIEFEEKCRLRTLALYGVRLAYDAAGKVQVDWSTVPPPGDAK